MTGAPLPDPDISTDAAALLAARGLAGEPRWPWVSVGRTQRQQGWKIHLSCVPIHLARLIIHVVRQHRRAHFPFKVIMSAEAAAILNEGSFGESQIGKCATIYPEDDGQFADLVAAFAGIEDVDGPRVPDDIWLGGIVHARFGGFNPVIRRDALGQIGRFISLPDGSLAPDRYDPELTHDRFIRDFGRSPIAARLRRCERLPRGLMNGRYLPAGVLRDSSKGALLQAFDISVPDRVRPMLIKQGRAHTLSDQYGHDIRNRLKHQEAMHEIAAAAGVSPACDSYFEIEGDGYLPIEFQRNDNFEARVQTLLGGQTIDHCDLHVRQTVLHALVMIGEQVQRLHEMGVVHRDLSPSNVLLGQNGVVLLSDLEIAWRPGSPIYGKGTPGFMAPEQGWNAPPVPSADVHAYAALILYAVTGVDPRRLPKPARSDRWQSIALLGQSLGSELWSALRDGLAEDPRDRPNVAVLCRAVRQTAELLVHRSLRPTERQCLNRTDIDALLHAGTASLTSPALLDPRLGIWLSAPIRGGGPELRRGLNRGVAGVLYYCTQYQRHYSLDEELQEVCRTNAGWLIADRSAIDYCMPGLHFGEAGVLVALYSARAAGLTDFADSDVAHLWRAVLEHPLDWLDITHGAAGVIVALAQLESLSGGCEYDLPAEIARRLAHLIATQRVDGAWTVPDGVDGMSGETLTGFAHGTAGIASVLAVFGPRYGSEACLQASLRAADWLLRAGIGQDDGSLVWPYSDVRAERWTWWCHGGPGISTLFLALHAITREPRFVTVIERCFGALPPHFNPANLSLCHGAAGLGELLLDAAGVLDSTDFNLRAEELASVICARHARGMRDVYWIVEDTDFVSADLMVGMSGVLHFLLRLSSRDPGITFPPGSTLRRACAFRGHGRI